MQWYVRYLLQNFNNPSQISLHFSHTGINPCLVNNGGCDHICTYTGANTRECSCIPPYELSLDGVTCLKLPIIKPPPTGFPTVGPPPRPIGKSYRVEHILCLSLNQISVIADELLEL